MPEIVHLTLPWVHVASKHVYALGGSMGGQETLLLLARYPHLLAGAAAFDPVVDFALQSTSPEARVHRRLPKAVARPDRPLAAIARALRARRVAPQGAFRL